MSEFSLKLITPARPVILPHLAVIAVTGLGALLAALAALVGSIS